MNFVNNIPQPENEPVQNYAPGSAERNSLKSTIIDLSETDIEIPLFIGGMEVRSGDLGKSVEPHCHRNILAKYHKARSCDAENAVKAAMNAKNDWASLSFVARSSVFLKAAELLRTKYRYILNAATMLNQSKNPLQAEIDSACEMIDFWRFNAFYAQEIFKGQPDWSPVGTLNSMEYRPLEGFVYAVSPFNFTSIAGNLPAAPALMGNTVVWKPAANAVFSAWFLLKILREAGLPAGVINVVSGNSQMISDIVLASPDLGAVHFTGSTAVFNDIWQKIAMNIANYRSYPRIVGETGGKNYVFVHPSADIEAVVVALLRGAFEYQGQKCSAASRAYIPKSLWAAVREKLIDMMGTMTMGDVRDFSNFINAVISQKSFDKITKYIEQAKASTNARILYGGEYDDSEGYFIKPTLIETDDPLSPTMMDELFGPVLTVYPYEDSQIYEVLDLCANSSSYALTGAIFAQDRLVINDLSIRLRDSAGNFYINDKPTGAVVGQQPFGGGRASGTNDKAGSPMNLMRWVSCRTIKETYVPPYDYRYPFMASK
jgi:1-pyrroline-5-carboxylate dehydrogenase